MDKFRIPVYKPFLGEEEKNNVIRCLDSTWISSKGEFITVFEEKFAKYLGVNYATTVSNGTVALHLALVALGIGPGDEVIVPTLTYIASVNAIVYTGATPIFVDSIEDTWQMNPEEVKKRINQRTKAVIAVHLYGHPCAMDELSKICREKGIFLVEDCAEAIGSKFNGQYVGTFGDISTFSFFGNKTITTGEGGMVVTNDETLHERIVHYKGQGLAKYREYWHDVVGYNYRMTNICAAIGVAQLGKIDFIINRKRRIAELYETEFENTGILFHKQVGNVFHSFWMCSILMKDSNERDFVRSKLGERGIETRPLFYPIHTMPMYSKRYEKHHVAENLGWRGINLPSYVGLKDDELTEICNIILNAINN
ncbi:MAG: DegT/DnrJ/EryC1/StrS aminotransferase family protein [Chitinophagaceae bacterium]|nr:MAG: DegT/DnrJ/EryC1/StrS aminotransferase family protein [Chitinophagaceae bacterium]